MNDVDLKKQFLTIQGLSAHMQASGFLLEDSLKISWCQWRGGPTPTHPELGCETL